MPEAPAVDPQKVQAQALFREARLLIAARNYSGAIDLLERSQALRPSVGALLNLGNAYRMQGRLATARQYYLQAVKLADDGGDSKRREFAESAASELEGDVPTLTLRVTTSSVQPIEILIDNAAQGPDAWGQPIFLDPGQHEVMLRIHGRPVWQEEVDLRDGSRHTVVVPSIAVDGSKATVAVQKRTLAVQQAPPVLRDDPLLSRSLVTWSVLGVAALTLGGGTVYAAIARAQSVDSNRYCTRDDVCSPEGKRLRDAAGSDATRATVLLSVGGAALVGAALLWLTKPAESGAKTEISLVGGPAQLQLQLRGPF